MGFRSLEFTRAGGDVSQADQGVGSDVAVLAIGKLFEQGDCLFGLALDHPLGSKAGFGGGHGGVLAVLGDEDFQRRNGGVLLVIVPLAFGQQQMGALGSLGA